jgi:hypothetical protein
MSEVAVSAGLVTFGPPLEPEACSGARGALKERKRQVNNQSKRYAGSKVKKRDLPRGNRPLFLRNGHANLLPLLLLRCVGLGLHASLPASTSAGGRRSLVQRGGVDNHVIRDS